MILQKVLATGRSAAVRKVLSPVSDALAVSRRNKGVFTPPTVKISTGEKIITSLILAGSIMAVPAWIVVHIPEYGK